MFDPVDPKQSFPELERGILRYWKEEDIFKRSIKQRKDGCDDVLDSEQLPDAIQNKREVSGLVGPATERSLKGKMDRGRKPTRCPSTYSFYDGPPFATGLPHYGNLLAGTIKDVIPRYQTMRGKCVERRFGWDCHGLPIENLIEKEEGIKNKRDIESLGIGRFNELCHASVLRYTSEWRSTVERMGRWVDMDWDYRTMDPEYMESIWWAFKEVFSKGLLYEGNRPIHICPRCATPLSNFEVSQGYKEVTDVGVTVKFELVDEPGTFLLAWTTTPWTLPGNLFLAVHPNERYVRFIHRGEEENTTYIASESFLINLAPGYFGTSSPSSESQYLKDGAPFDGKKLIEKNFHYNPLFSYFKKQYEKTCFRIVAGEFIAPNEGTGIVHIAPGFGEDDFRVWEREIKAPHPNPLPRGEGNSRQRAKEQRATIPLLQHVTMDGRFIEEVKDFAGWEVKPQGDPMKTDRAITKFLEKHGKVFSSETITHSAPHCWRCESPLLNFATSSWFVAVERIKENLLKNAEKIEWIPKHLKEGRFGKWLENARDWSISRNRYWGTPIPIWRTPNREKSQTPNSKLQVPRKAHNSNPIAHSLSDVTVIGSRDDLMAYKKIRFTKVTVLRHAESEGNLIPIYQGAPPGTPLTAHGREQAKATAEFLACAQLPTVIYTSPLKRAQQTAEILAKKTGATVIVDDRLREVSFGTYEGKTVDFSDLTLVKERRAHKLEKGTPESIYHFPGMETWDAVEKRVRSFLEEVLPRHRSHHIVIVTHADPIQNIRHFFTGEDPFKLSHQPYPTFADPFTFFWDHDREAQMDLHKDRVDELIFQGSPGKESIELTLVRHGETDWNKENRAQGCEADIPLNTRGTEQALCLAHSLKKARKNFDVIVTSDLKRAAHTANILSKELDVPIVGKWGELRERCMGEWSGKTVADILKAHPSVGDHIRTVTLHHETPPQGETLSCFLKRAEDACQRLLQKFPGKRILLVSHGGMTRAIHAILENLPYEDAALLDPKNAEALPLTLNPFLVRIPEILDCWFESGSMPYAQQHFPFDRSSLTTHHSASSSWPRGYSRPTGFPADFIAEGVDQTRLWFYTLLVLSTILFEEAPYRNVVVNGIVLAEDGKKMSKRLKNYPDPNEVVERHGADAVRFTLMSSPAVRGEDLRFSEKLVQETVRAVLLPLWNAYCFFVTHANAAHFEPLSDRRASPHSLDRWIRAEVQDLVNRMTQELDRYDLSSTCGELHDTIDAITNWYIRLSRRRFAGKAEGGTPEEQHMALQTLHDVLITLAQLLAPFCPFLTDAIYLNLVPEEHGSIHLTDWPEERELIEEEVALIEKTRLLRRITSLGLNVRAQANVKLRQPLRKAIIALPLSYRPHLFTTEDHHLLREELNVRDLLITPNPEEIGEAYVSVDLRAIGPRFGERTQEIIDAAKRGDFEVKDTGEILVLDEVLSPAEARVMYRGREGEHTAADQGIVVSIDTKVTEPLKEEGLLRDLIHTIQHLRKEASLAPSDRILLSIEGVPHLLKKFEGTIAREVNAVMGKAEGKPHTINFDGKEVAIVFEKQP